MHHHLDIDAQDPGYDSPVVRHKKRKRNKIPDRYYNIFVGSSYGYRSVKIGISPHKMLDWRSLERRYSELALLAESASKKFWTALHNVYIPHAEKVNEVWIAVSEDKLVKYDGKRHAYSSCCLQFEAESLLKKTPGEHDEYVFIPRHPIGDEIHRLSQKESRLLWAKTVYRCAFQRAIEDRLRKCNEINQRIGSTYSYSNVPFTVIIANDDRHHIVSFNAEGHFLWHDGKLLTTSSTGKHLNNACEIQDSKKCCSV